MLFGHTYVLLATQTNHTLDLVFKKCGIALLGNKGYKQFKIPFSKVIFFIKKYKYK